MAASFVDVPMDAALGLEPLHVGEVDCRKVGALAQSSAGCAAHRGHQYEIALTHFSCGLALLGAPTDALIDFGLAQDTPSPSISSALMPLVRALLVRRAAAALQLGRYLRALADTGMALKQGFGVWCVLLRSRALMQIGGWAAAADLLAHVTTGSLKQRMAVALLRAAARARNESVPRRIGEVVDAANASAPLPRELAFVHGSLEMQHEMGDGKGRGWVATAHIPAGTLLLVEPATFPTVGPQLTSDEKDTLPLLQAVAAALRSGGPFAERLKEYLACMCPLEGDEGTAAATTLRDSLAMPYVDAIGATAGLSVEATRRLDRKLQRNQMVTAVVLNSEPEASRSLPTPTEAYRQPPTPSQPHPKPIPTPSQPHPNPIPTPSPSPTGSEAARGGRTGRLWLGRLPTLCDLQPFVPPPRAVATSELRQCDHCACAARRAAWR